MRRRHLVDQDGESSRAGAGAPLPPAARRACRGSRGSAAPVRRAGASRRRRAANPGPSAICSSFATTTMVDNGVPSSCAAAAASPSSCERCCSRREHELRRGERVRHQAALLGHLPRIGADEHDRHHVRDPDRQDVERRQHQLLVEGPWQRPEIQRDQASSRRRRSGRAAACSATATRSRRSAPAPE